MSAFSGCFALEAVLFPQTTSVSMNAFENCVQLHLVFLPKLSVLKMAVFKGCRSLTFLSLPAVETVQLGAFDGIDLQYLQLDSVKTIQSLPSKLKNLVLSSSFSENTAALPQSSLTIFGIPDTNAQKLAETAHAQFRAVPAIVFDAPESFTPEDEIIAVFTVNINGINPILPNKAGRRLRAQTVFGTHPHGKTTPHIITVSLKATTVRIHLP